MKYLEIIYIFPITTTTDKRIVVVCFILCNFYNIPVSVPPDAPACVVDQSLLWVIPSQGVRAPDTGWCGWCGSSGSHCRLRVALSFALSRTHGHHGKQLPNPTMTGIIEPHPAGLGEADLCQIQAVELEQGLPGVLHRGLCSVACGRFRYTLSFASLQNALWDRGKWGAPGAAPVQPPLTDTCARALRDDVLHSSQNCSPKVLRATREGERHSTLGKCFYLSSLGAYMAITHAAWSRMLKTISLCAINKGLMWFNCINYAILLSGVVKGKFRQRTLPL